MTPTSRLFRGRHAAAAVAAVALTLATTACSGAGEAPVSDGPAEVSVTKSASPSEAGDQQDLARLDPENTTGSAAVFFGDIPEQVWLPEAVQVLPGIDEATPQAGSFILRVPAAWERTAQIVSDQQDPDAFVDYYEIDVAQPGAPSGPAGDGQDTAGSSSQDSLEDTPAPSPDEGQVPAPTSPPVADASAGKVIQAVTATHRITLSILGEDDPSFTIVAVKWEPAPTGQPTSTSGTPGRSNTGR